MRAGESPRAMVCVWEEREKYGREVGREEGFNPAWIMGQTGAGEQEERCWRERERKERERKSHYSTIHPYYSSSRSVLLSRHCVILFWIRWGWGRPRQRTAGTNGSSVEYDSLHLTRGQDWTQLKTEAEVLPRQSQVIASFPAPRRSKKRGAWRREVDNGRTRNRIKKCRNMARVCCESWCTVVTFDTGDQSFLDSIKCRGNKLSWHQVIRYLICYWFCLNVLSIPTFLQGNLFPSFGHMTLWVPISCFATCKPPLGRQLLIPFDQHHAFWRAYGLVSIPCLLGKAALKSFYLKAAVAEHILKHLLRWDFGMSGNFQILAFPTQSRPPTVTHTHQVIYWSLLCHKSLPASLH